MRLLHSSFTVLGLVRRFLPGVLALVAWVPTPVRSAAIALPPPPAPGTFRVLSWNVSQENLFKFSDRYRAIFRITVPDILLLDEIQGGRSPAEIARILHGIDGSTNTTWNVVIGSAGGYQRAGVVSRHPVEPVPELDGLRYPAADFDRLKTLVPESAWNSRVQRNLDLGIPTAGGILRIGERRVLAVAIDLQCCNGTNDWPEIRRQMETRIIHQAIQQTLERRQVDAVLVAGDLNLVGGSQPLDILRRPLPDPHGSLVPAAAVQLDGQETWTWDGRGSAFPSGRLDYSLYSPASLQESRAFVVSSEDLPAAVLSAHDLKPETSRELSDHLPIIVDYQWRPSPTRAQ
ncbi:MAG: endonuclease/exonuclease/phosphatase family protein [Verrucomicrobiales bacterium]|nr:endonuclease/exonuclease/phosphatase family protein [Verrucomicrobiales bacterium]